MEWTATPPTVPGFYWLKRPTDRVYVVEVGNVPGFGWYVYWPGSDSDALLENITGEWYGPLEVP